MLRPQHLALLFQKLIPRVNSGGDERVPWPERLAGALDWLVYAAQNSPEGGIPACYDLLRGGWRPAYPETTGYIIPSLLHSAAYLKRPELSDLAFEAGHFLLRVRLENGGLGHWDPRGGYHNSPIVFDTGMGISGWMALWRQSNDPAWLGAVVRAADWLVQVQDPGGAWQEHQYLGTVKTIDARVASILIDVGQATGRAGYVEAGRRNLDWVMRQQQPNGWFKHASFRPGEAPFSHNIAYIIGGLLDAGTLLGEERYIKTAGVTAMALLKTQRADGSLPGRYTADWKPASPSSCLTGNCQMALHWIQYYRLERNPVYRLAAQRAISSVARTQDMITSHKAVRGAIAGSAPL
jgi:hypothetical protein